MFYEKYKNELFKKKYFFNRNRCVFKQSTYLIFKIYNYEIINF